MTPDPSILIEQISQHRRFTDIATAVVVLGLLGEYRHKVVRLVKALIARNWRSARATFVLLIFPLMVVCGVAGELWSNFQVSAIEYSWEVTQLPRDLTEAQQKEIASAISSFAPAKFDLATHQDIEPMRLLDKIEAALTRAGWTEVPPPPEVNHFQRINQPPVAVRTVSGVWVLYPVSDPAMATAAKALVATLRAANLIVSDIGEVVPNDYDRMSIHVWVGAKP